MTIRPTPGPLWIQTRAVVDVDDFDRIRCHSIEYFTGIPNQWNNSNGGTVRDPSRALRPLADTSLNRLQSRFKSRIGGGEMTGDVTQDLVEIVERFVGIDNLHVGRCLANNALTSSGAANRPWSAAWTPRSIPASSSGVG